MKNKFYLLLITILFSACQSKTSSNQNTPDSKPAEAIKSADKKTNGVKEEPNAIESETKKLADISIADEAQYSPEFVSQIRSFGGIEQIDLEGNLVILDQKDSIQFPEIPRLNKSYTLKGKEGNLSLSMTVKRVNYTSVEYKIEMNELGKSNKSEMGLAHLSGFFFLGSESDVDDQTEESYFCTEFSVAKDPCHLSIRIGNIEDSPDQALLAKVIKNCNGEIRDIDLDNFPTLRE